MFSVCSVNIMFIWSEWIIINIVSAFIKIMLTKRMSCKDVGREQVMFVKFQKIPTSHPKLEQKYGIDYLS